MGDDVVGNIDFRLGWSLVRSKRDVPRGIKMLKQAADLIPNNTEISIKLSGVLYQECPEPAEETLREALRLANTVVAVEQMNFEAFMLKGKILIKLRQNVAAMEPIEQAIRLLAEDKESGGPTANQFYFLGMC